MSQGVSLQDLAPWLAMGIGFLGTVWSMAKGYTSLDSRATKNREAIDSLRSALFDEAGEPRYLTRALYKELHQEHVCRSEGDLSRAVRLIESLQRKDNEFNDRLEAVNRALLRISILYGIEEPGNGGRDAGPRGKND